MGATADSLGTPRDDQQPRGAAVEAVDDPRALRVFAAGDTALEQRVDERACRVAGGGMACPLLLCGAEWFLISRFLS